MLVVVESTGTAVPVIVVYKEHWNPAQPRSRPLGSSVTHTPTTLFPAHESNDYGSSAKMPLFIQLDCLLQVYRPKMKLGTSCQLFS